jgi:hypothetical protein
MQARLSQFGGLSPVLEFLKKGRFRQRLGELFGEKKARSLLQLCIAVIAGAKSLEDAYRVAQDPLVRKFLGNPVGAIELARDFKSFTHTEIEGLHEWNLSLPILELLSFVDQSEELIFDVDATSVQKYGHQEGVEAGYIEKDKVEDCYQYLLFRLHNLNTFFYGTIRGGSAHSQNGYTQYLERFLPAFEKRWKLAFRTDSGFFSERAFDLYSKYDVRAFCKAPMIESRQSFAQVSQDLAWISDPKQPGVEYASYLTKTAAQTTYREIYKRTKLHSGQMSLFESVSYRYDCLVTNDFTIREWEAYAFYNGRAHVENNIRELKNDYQLGKIITESFDANDVITQVQLLSYILVQHFKRTCLPEDMNRMQLGTLRWSAFNIPAGLFREARKQWVRIQNVFRAESFYATIYRNLSRTRSWLLCPPTHISAAQAA